MQSGQTATDAYFHRVAEHWKTVYLGSGLKAAIYGARAHVTLSWVDELRLPSTATVIDVGCGTGLLTVALAQRGFHVHAFDRVDRMLSLAMERAQTAGVGQNLEVGICDARELPCGDGTVDIAIALGLLPWVESPDGLLDELTRVLAPGGHMIISADNSLRLVHLIDPFKNPWMSSLRNCTKRVLAPLLASKKKATRPRASMHSLTTLRAWLGKRDLEVIRTTTLGFGPFSLGRWRLFAEPKAVALNRRLQSLVERGFPVIDQLGNHCLVLARKPF
jgi:ubiquinone/menaquinone biosynthesis C-methylase UbiE